jgi:diguanylate cyclase (GGDEF)-like protein
VARAAFDLARKQSMPLTIGLIDIDHFKKINDRCGHAVGDAVLREFACVGRSALRENDTLGRWGGEEFLVVLPGITLDVALGVAERLRAAALDMDVPGLAMGMRVTVSSGLATIDGDFATLEEVIAQADAALYEAKNNGRDLVCIAPESYSLSSTAVRRVLKSSGIAMQTGQFPRYKSS